MFKFKFNKTHFSKLSDKHVLALAIYAEEEDSKIYYYFANTFKKIFLKQLNYLMKWEKKKMNIENY